MGLRIFVIDDEEGIRDTFRIHLEEQGHEVLTCDRPQACFSFKGHDCRNDYPCGHVLLIDHFLPGMNGLDFIEMMEKRGCKGAMRNKFLMSGDTTSIDQAKVIQLGCNLIQKPVCLDKLDEIINGVMKRVDPCEQLAELVF